MAKTFGTIRVKHEDASDSEALVLTFIDRRAFDDTRRAIMKSVGLKIVDDYFGYAVFGNAEDAMKGVRAFCRQPIAASTRLKLTEALDHINAVRAVLEKPIKDQISMRAECGADLELAATRIVGAITQIRTGA